MQELFDKKISSKISTTFENYEVSFEESSWEKMKEKLKKKKRTPVIFLYNIAKAAIVLAFVGIPLFFVYKSNQNIISKRSFYSQLSFYENRTFRDKTSYHENEKKPSTDYFSNTNNDNNVEKSLDNNLNNNDVYNLIVNDTDCTNIYFDKENFLKLQDSSKTFFAVNSIDCVEINLQKFDIEDIIDSIKQALVDKSIDCTEIQLQKIVIDESIFEQNKDNKRESRLTIGVAVASNYSYSENYVGNSMNFGGGITGNIEILKNLSLNTGIIVGNQKMELGAKNLFARDEAVFADSFNSVAEESNSKVSFISLDVPINLQYDIKNFYISTGVSSMTYLNEKYENSYFSQENIQLISSDGIVKEEIALVENSENTEFDAFNRFDLAKLLNFSFGYKVPIKKGEIIFEPYLKYPLGKLTSGEIAFGLGGVSIKYNF